MSIKSVIPSNHLILCHPHLLPPSIFPSIRVFSNESVFRVRWPKYWSFSFSISPSNEYSGLISFRMDWWDLLAVQGTLKSLLQHGTDLIETTLFNSVSYTESEVAQSCPTVCGPMGGNLPGSSIHRIFHARILEWFTISSSRGSSQPRDRTQVCHTADRFFTI